MADPNKKNTKPTVLVKNTQDTESIISMVLGAMVVVVIGALLFSYVRDRRAATTDATPIPSTSPAPIMVEELPAQVTTEKDESGKDIPTNLPATYVVKTGDSSWKIAEAFYGSGFNYVDIEQENGLKPDQDLVAGSELTVPRVQVRNAQEAAVVRQQYMEKAGSASGQVGPSKGDTSAEEAELAK